MSKPKGKAPAFQLYAGDFLTDVMDWSDEQVGAHIRLLCWSWVNRRGIPRDTQRLTRIAPTAVEAWSVIGDKWVEGPDDTWVNERLESTRAESDAFRDSQRKRSLLAVEARAKKNAPKGRPNGKPMGTPMGDPLEGEEEDNTQERKERASEKPELTWPAFAGEKVKAKWAEFIAYRIAEKKQRYRSVTTEQRALDLAARYFTNGPDFVAGLDHTMARTWAFPVDPSEHKYPHMAKAPDKPVELNSNGKVPSYKPWLV